MTFDRNEFQKLQNQALNSQRPHFTALAQAEVKAKNLTGHGDWDYFISLLQEMAETHGKAVDGYKQTLESPDLVNQDEIMKTKISLSIEAARKACLEQVMELPNNIINAGGNARKILEKMD